MTIFNLVFGAGQAIFFGTSSDTKPVASNGCLFIETDTGKFFCRDSSVWVEKLNNNYSVGGHTHTLADITDSSTLCLGNDSRLSDSRTPTAHATNHKSGGSDAIKLDELSAPTDVTTLNASTAHHGLLPKLDGLTTTYLRGDGTFATPAGASDIALSNLSPSSDTTITAGYSAVVSGVFTIASGTVLDVLTDSVFAIL